MKRVMPLLRLLLVVVWAASCLATDGGNDNHHHHYLNTFAVQVDGGLTEAQSVAEELGFSVDRELPSIGAFILTHPEVRHRSKRSADHHVSQLKSHPKVRYVQQEVELKRVKRDIIHDKQVELPIREIKDSSMYHREELPAMSARNYEDEVTFNDPFYRDMWYLKNKGQSGGERYLDMNVQVVWASGYSGQGVVVCILDDGVDHEHPDLSNNYDPKASTDLNDKSDKKQDPMPNKTNPGNSHGTRCAGEIAAAANNQVCGVGVAYDARIGGVRILDGIVTDSLEGEALTFHNDYIHIYSASWGPNDNGRTMEAPNYFAKRALMTGVQKGRGGLGNIFVWATGNGGMNGDDCNADGYTSSVETLSVGSITDWGKQPFYMENCTSTLAVVPTGGEEYRGQEADTGQIKLKVVTTDMGGGCIENFQGTSSAAPLGAGCLANVLQANPQLTWRDVQHIVVHGTRIPSVDSSWTINGGGHHVSHKFGFGLMDCGRMVQLAQDWRNVPEQHVCQYNRTESQKLEFGGTVNETIYVDACKGDSSRWIQRLEHVQVRIKLNTRRRGDTNIFLISPSGTRSELLSPRRNDDHKGMWEFTFMTVHSWDENPTGTWRLEVFDRPGRTPVGRGLTSHAQRLAQLRALLDKSNKETKSTGYLLEWSLILYGTAGERYNRAFSAKQDSKKAFQPSEDAVLRMKRDETETARHVQVKRASTMKRQNKRVNSGGQVSNAAVRKLAARLNSLLEKEDAHEHVKRVLEEQPSSNGWRKSQRYQYANTRGLGQRPSTPREETDQLLTEVLRSLEHLLESRKREEQGHLLREDTDSSSSSQNKESRSQTNVLVTSRVLEDLLTYLENSSK